MNTKLRVDGLLGSPLAILFLVCGLAACTTSAVKSDGGSGGSSTGGAGGGATGGSGGSADAGYATSDGMLCPLPTMALITDFAYTPPDGGAGDASADGGADAAAAAASSINFGTGAGLSGGEFVYPTSGNWPVTSDVTQSNWHLTGTLGDYSGFGLFFNNCSHVDASAYNGISFTISAATPPTGGIITMGIGTLDDVIAASWLNTHGGNVAADAPGRCIPAGSTATTTQYSQTTCGDPQIPITITGTPGSPQTVNILWTDFTTGKPEAAVKPSDITSIYWFFPPPAGAGTTTPTTYPVDITIDNLSFISP